MYEMIKTNRHTFKQTFNLPMGHMLMQVLYSQLGNIACCWGEEVTVELEWQVWNEHTSNFILAALLLEGVWRPQGHKHDL